jgi:FtsP/CotA-like multicopper oxidase with cupredoxin domain
MSRRLRLLVACLATSVVLAPVTWLWASSLLPDAYSVMEMGYVDHGTGAAADTSGHAGTHDGTPPGGTDITELVADPDRSADVQVDLVAEQREFRLPSGRTVQGYTLNGGSPGPVIRAVQGQLVQVTVDNRSVADGLTLHWHGIDVPNAMDGVAGVTQDAVPEAGSFTYRFVAEQAGTYWYHSHQLSQEQVKRGLLGAVVVSPEDQDPEVVDIPALVHIYDGVRTVNGHDGDLAVDAVPGRTVRVRVINTDNGVMAAWVAGAPYRLLAVDGTEVNQPAVVQDESVLVTAGARAELEVAMPEDGPGSGSSWEVRRPWCSGAPTCRRRRSPACDGRSTATCSRTCRCSPCPRARWSGCTSRTTAARRTRCTFTATTPWCSPATG